MTVLMMPNTGWTVCFLCLGFMQTGSEYRSVHGTLTDCRRLATVQYPKDRKRLTENDVPRQPACPLKSRQSHQRDCWKLAWPQEIILFLHFAANARSVPDNSRPLSVRWVQSCRPQP